MTDGVKMWAQFVAEGVDDSRAHADALAATPARAKLSAHAYLCFNLAGQSLLVGAEHMGRLALRCERCIDTRFKNADYPHAPARRNARRP